MKWALVGIHGILNLSVSLQLGDKRHFAWSVRPREWGSRFARGSSRGAKSAPRFQNPGPCKIQELGQIEEVSHVRGTTTQHQLIDNWVAVRQLSLSFHNPETMSFAIYPCCGNLKSSSLTAAQTTLTLQGTEDAKVFFCHLRILAGSSFQRLV